MERRSGQCLFFRCIFLESSPCAMQSPLANVVLPVRAAGEIDINVPDAHVVPWPTRLTSWKPNRVHLCSKGVIGKQMLERAKYVVALVPYSAGATRGAVCGNWQQAGFSNSKCCCRVEIGWRPEELDPKNRVHGPRGWYLRQNRLLCAMFGATVKSCHGKSQVCFRGRACASRTHQPKPCAAWWARGAASPLDLAKPVPRNMILKQKTFTVIDGQLRLAN